MMRGRIPKLYGTGNVQQIFNRLPGLKPGTIMGRREWTDKLVNLPNQPQIWRSERRSSVPTKPVTSWKRKRDSFLKALSFKAVGAALLVNIPRIFDLFRCERFLASEAELAAGFLQCGIHTDAFVEDEALSLPVCAAAFLEIF